MVGTISYMAPEQFKLGMDADQMVDIFAFGDVFYELITGEHPFQADDPGFGKIFLELENVANVGAAPGVDGLILVTHGADVMPRAREHSHELVLRAVGVLVFINQDVLETLVVIFANAGSRFQQPHGFY